MHSENLRTRITWLRKTARNVALGSAAASILAAASLPHNAKAQSGPELTYDLAIVCASYYTVLYFYANEQNPGTEQTNQFRSFAADWARLAQVMNTTGNFDAHFDAAQQELNQLILDDNRKDELSQVQTLCLDAGIARFGWGSN